MPRLALNWLAAHQNANGTWGANELAPRDTSRVLIAPRLLNKTFSASTAGYSWLAAQSGLGANRFIAEQAYALSLGKIDNSAALALLLQQRSVSGGDLGGFLDNTGDSLDSPTPTTPPAIGPQ